MVNTDFVLFDKTGLVIRSHAGAGRTNDLAGFNPSREYRINRPDSRKKSEDFFGIKTYPGKNYLRTVYFGKA